MRYVDDPPIEDHQHRGYFVENVGSPHVATGTLGLNLRALSGRRASNVAARGAHSRRQGCPSALLLLTRRCAELMAAQSAAGRAGRVALPTTMLDEPTV
jgi:hypothetical protein